MLKWIIIGGVVGWFISKDVSMAIVCAILAVMLRQWVFRNLWM